MDDITDAQSMPYGVRSPKQFNIISFLPPAKL